jgi:acetolactate synthase I/II/III large subunit
MNKNKHAHPAVHGDHAENARGLNDAARGGTPTLTAAAALPDWMRQIDQWREKEPLRFNDRPMRSCRSTPSSGSGRSCATAASSTIPSSPPGVGQHQMWAAQYFQFNTPRNWITSAAGWARWASACRGHGRAGRSPLKLVIDIDGDGSFLMNVQELATCLREKLPVKVLLLNNQHLGMVVQWEDRFHGGNRAHTYLGAGMDSRAVPGLRDHRRRGSAAARSISRKGDLDAALVEMIDSKGPFVLNVSVVPYQEHVLPMIPSGMTVRDIIKA